MIDNLSTNNVVNIITTNTSGTSTVILGGNTSGSKSVSGYVRGVVYNHQTTQVFTNGESFDAIQKPSCMLSGGNWYAKPKPVFASLAAQDVVNVRGHGAVGDGVTDDLAAIQTVVSRYAGTGKMGK